MLLTVYFKFKFSPGRSVFVTLCAVYIVKMRVGVRVGQVDVEVRRSPSLIYQISMIYINGDGTKQPMRKTIEILTTECSAAAHN